MWFMTMRVTQILERAIEITMHLLKIMKQLLFSKTVKYKAMYGMFFQIEIIISEKCMVIPPNFLFGYQEHLLSSAFSA